MTARAKSLGVAQLLLKEDERSPVEHMRIANLIRRQRSRVEKCRQAIDAARDRHDDETRVLGALLEKYPGHDEP